MQRNLSLALALAAIVLAAAADSANAQGGGGRGRGGRGFGFGRTNHQIALAALPEVETELKLTDEQKTQIADLSDEFDDERRDAFGGGGGGGGGGFGGGEEGRAARAKLNADYAAKLNEMLEEPQQKRLQEIYVQVNGTPALLDDAIVTALKITDEQKDDLNAALDDQRQAMMDAFQDFRDMTPEERTEELAALNKERDDALLAVLTDEQKTQFEAMKGEKIDIDMSQLRRGFGGRGGGGGFGGGGGGRRGGDRPADDGGDADQGA
jgi:Spy/CpxP family protein refolding chaperone